MFPGAMPAQANKKERQLIKFYKQLDSTDKKALLSFAEFLTTRTNSNSDSDTTNHVVPSEPLAIPRPEEESVIKAIKRLSKNYPMVDKETILHPISGLMTSHIMQGKKAVDVIDELENLFLEQHNSLNQAHHKS